MIVYELRNGDGELVAREFNERKIAKTRISLENRGSGTLRLEKLFLCGDRDDIEKREITPLKKYIDKGTGKW
jgi:hypothetical protein